MLTVRCLLTLVVLAAAIASSLLGCRGDGPFYALRVTNRSSQVLLIVAGSNAGGTSPYQPFEAPADGQERITETIPLDTRTATVSVFDQSCTLVATVAVAGGIYDLAIDSAGNVTLSETKPPVNEVPVLEESVIECP
jgi:hypothetical protein